MVHNPEGMAVDGFHADLGNSKLTRVLLFVPLVVTTIPTIGKLLHQRNLGCYSSTRLSRFSTHSFAFPF